MQKFRNTIKSANQTHVDLPDIKNKTILIGGACLMQLKITMKNLDNEF